MIHPDTELRYINPSIGYGVVAKKLIPAGTITWVMDAFDIELPPEKLDSLSAAYKAKIDKYAFRNRVGNYIICWDHGKYINHSFDSNCLTTAYDFEIAIRDIFPGEQLTDDYGYLNINTPFYAYDEGLERKVVYPDDLLRYYEDWDKTLGRTFFLIEKVNQPLKKYFEKESWQEIQLVLEGRKHMKSILTNYFPQL